jgi:hypothetical protein
LSHPTGCLKWSATTCLEAIPFLRAGYRLIETSYNIRKLKNLFFSFSLIGVRVRKQKGTEINIPNWQKYLLAAIQAARCSKEKAEILS